MCNPTLDWLYANCDQVLITLDNWDVETEDIIKEYQNKYPEQTYIAYCDEPVNEERNKIRGQQKKRFKLRQAEIREFAIKELKKINNDCKIDLLVWPDSDEIFIDEFPKYLEEFWNSDYTWMMCGCIEVWDSMKQLISQVMSPHGRVYKFNSETTVYPWKGRCRYHPYWSQRPWKIRHVVIHLCHLTEKDRERRWFFNNSNIEEHLDKLLWKLPRDVSKMTASQIAEYQPGAHQSPSKHPPILLRDYLNNK